MRPSILTLLVAAGCKGPQPQDTGITVDCEGSGPTSLVIGQGAGSTFIPLETGDSVGLDVAPQGGFGVSVRALTTGLKANDLVDILLVTEIAGVEVGSFLNEEGTLYCQDEGFGLIWGVVVGFDPAVYESNDDLLALNGQAVKLVVTATDTEGDEATGRVEVTVEVGS